RRLPEPAVSDEQRDGPEREPPLPDPPDRRRPDGGERDERDGAAGRNRVGIEARVAAWLGTEAEPLGEARHDGGTEHLDAPRAAGGGPAGGQRVGGRGDGRAAVARLLVAGDGRGGLEDGRGGVVGEAAAEEHPRERQGEVMATAVLARPVAGKERGGRQPPRRPAPEGGAPRGPPPPRDRRPAAPP